MTDTPVIIAGVLAMVGAVGLIALVWWMSRN